MLSMIYVPINLCPRVHIYNIMICNEVVVIGMCLCVLLAVIGIGVLLVECLLSLVCVHENIIKIQIYIFSVHVLLCHDILSLYCRLPVIKQVGCFNTESLLKICKIVFCRF